MLNHLIRPKTQNSKNQTLIKQYILSCRLKTSKKHSLNTLIPATMNSLNTSKIKSIMTESLMTNESVIIVPNNLLESQSKISIIEKTLNNNSGYHNCLTVSNTKEKMFKKEFESVEILFNGYNSKTCSNEIFNLEKYKEIVLLIEKALTQIKSVYQRTVLKEQYEKEESFLYNTNTKVNEITIQLYTGLFNEIFNSISIIPNYINRYYIKLTSLPHITVCFLKPLLVNIFVLNLSLSKEEFVSICFKIYHKMTLCEKAKFVDAYKSK